MWNWTDWVHAIVSTYGAWLPGDPRGFRDHGHRVHSSGDYRTPPPIGEHAGLLAVSKARVRAKVVLVGDLRSLVAQVFIDKMENQGCPVRIAAFAATHAHLLVRVGQSDAKPILGKAKQRASHAARGIVSGGLWAQGCHVVRIGSEAQYRETTHYIAAHGDEGALVWVNPKVRSRASE